MSGNQRRSPGTPPPKLYHPLLAADPPQKVPGSQASGRRRGDARAQQCEAPPDAPRLWALPRHLRARCLQPRSQKGPKLRFQVAQLTVVLQPHGPRARESKQPQPLQLPPTLRPANLHAHQDPAQDQ